MKGSKVPQEVWLHIFSYLTTAEDLCYVSQVSKLFNAISSDDKLWAPLCSPVWEIKTGWVVYLAYTKIIFVITVPFLPFSQDNLLIKIPFNQTMQKTIHQMVKGSNQHPQEENGKAVPGVGTVKISADLWSGCEFNACGCARGWQDLSRSSICWRFVRFRATFHYRDGWLQGLDCAYTRISKN